MAGPMKATKAQVQGMLRDMEKSFERERNAMRTQRYAAEEALANRYIAEMKRRAAEYGFELVGAQAWRQNQQYQPGYTVIYKIK